MTALTWINPSMAFFRPVEVKRALAHVDLDAELDSLWPELIALQSRMPPSAMLDAIQRHAAPRSIAREADDIASRRLS